VNEAFDVQIAGLRQRFCDRAISQSLTLEVIASDLDADADPAQIGDNIRTIAHSLAGAGGTFGFAGISAYANDLEEFATRPINSVELAEACRTLVKEIRRSVRAWSISRGNT
jgi:HPt (histidine-containing phosphotransfer) domain-containing protein